MDYYSKKLAGPNLKKCYELANLRIRRYLDSEIKYIISKIQSQDTVLELGCGYGRVMIEIDYNATRNGIIVCKDGFSSGTMNSNDFQNLGRQIGIPPTIEEVDEFSLFCEFIKK